LFIIGLKYHVVKIFLLNKESIKNNFHEIYCKYDQITIFHAFFIELLKASSDLLFVFSANIISNQITATQESFKFLITGI